MPSDNEIIVLENETVVTVIESTVTIVSVVEEANRIEVELLDGSTNTIENLHQDITLMVYQGDIFFANNASNLAGTSLTRTDFVITDIDINKQWFLPSDSRTIMHVMINQIDYAQWCEITPPGSGRVIYTVPPNGYEPELNDSVLIYWAP